MSCAAVWGDDSASRVALRGVVPADEYGPLHAAFDATTAQTRSWDVQSIPPLPIYCQAIDALRPVLRPLGTADGIAVRLLPSPTTHSLRLVDSDPIDFGIDAPAFASVLQVDYIGNDGSVSHYMPRQSPPAIPARRLRPNEHLRMFDTLPGAAFQVGPPYGTDLVVAIASSEPLNLARSADDGDTVPAYLTNLRNALQAARQRGVRVSVDLVPVVSIAKP
jgi:hypothetical protein